MDPFKLERSKDVKFTDESVFIKFPPLSIAAAELGNKLNRSADLMWKWHPLMSIVLRVDTRNYFCT